MAITPTETPTPIPAFAPVESPDPGSAEMEVDVADVEAVGVDVRSVDCHASPTAIACIKGVGYSIAVVVIDSGPTNEYVIVSVPKLLFVQGSVLYHV